MTPNNELLSKLPSFALEYVYAFNYSLNVRGRVSSA